MRSFCTLFAENVFIYNMYNYTRASIPTRTKRRASAEPLTDRGNNIFADFDLSRNAISCVLDIMYDAQTLYGCALSHIYKTRNAQCGGNEIVFSHYIRIKLNSISFKVRHTYTHHLSLVPAIYFVIYYVRQTAFAFIAFCGKAIYGMVYGILLEIIRKSRYRKA